MAFYFVRNNDFIQTPDKTFDRSRRPVLLNHKMIFVKILVLSSFRTVKNVNFEYHLDYFKFKITFHLMVYQIEPLVIIQCSL